MNRFMSVFSQILQLFSRLDFEKAVKATRAERHARGFTCWGQFVAMLFCQLSRAHSLQEICGGLASRFVALRAQPSHGFVDGAPPHKAFWLLVEWPESENGPTKYWLCDLPAGPTLRRLVRGAKCRWAIEQDYQQLKDELGLVSL